MLGAQAGLAVGLISSILTVLDTAAKIYSDINYAHYTPIAFSTTIRILPVIQNALQTVQSRINTAGVDEELCRKLQPTLERCKGKVLQLEIAFRRLIPYAYTSRHDRFSLVVAAPGEMETLAREILEDVKLLMETPTVGSNTSTEIKEIAWAIDELSTLPPSQFKDVSGSSTHNHSSGTINTNTGSGTANNNTSSGRQYIGQNQYFGDLSKAPDPAKELAEEYKRCLSSLSFATIDARRQDIATAHQDTCEWILRTSQFQQWRDRVGLETHNGVLWIKGKPGAGKSTLMKYTWQRRSELFKDHVAVAYFFNARGEKLEKTPLGMLRSITCQLLEQDLLYERFLPRFRAKEQRYKDVSWREAELKNFLLSQAKMPQSKPLLLHIDALDECRESDVRQVVAFLEEMSIVAVKANVTLNICLSSRHYPTISMKTSLEVTVEDVVGHDHDIARYVSDKLKKQDTILEGKIRDKAAGVFMWVVLVVAMLNRAYDEGKVEAIPQMLHELPGDLEEVFETLLNEDNPDKHETTCLMQWVLFSKRALKPEELYFGMIAGTQAKNLGALKYSEISKEDIQRRITNSSKGLMEIRKGKDRTVQFIHESVNDFLMRNERFETLDSALRSNPIGTSQDRLRDCCMSYLSMAELEAVKQSPKAEVTAAIYPLLKYASTYILEHAEEAQKRGVVQEKFLRWLSKTINFERLRHFHNAFERVPGVGCSKGVTPAYMLSLHGCPELLSAMPSKMEEAINVHSGPYGSALQGAAAQAVEEVVNVLLEKGANINAQGGLYGSALQAAAAKSRQEIVKVLLEAGADANAHCGPYGSALQAAAYVGNEEIVKMLLKKGANVSAQGGPNGTALQAAALKGKEEIVELLLRNGADVNVRGGAFGSALQAAATLGGKEEIVKTLLEQGADINMRGGPFGSALQAAAFVGKEELVKLLLKHGAKIDIQDGAFGSALQGAAFNSKNDIVEILIEHSADTDLQGTLYGSELQAAIFKDDQENMRMLLEQGVDVNIQGGLFGSALQVAAFLGSTDIVKLLLDHGADVNIHNEAVFGSALQAAAFSGNISLVKMLIKEGADVNNKGGVGGNALQVAAIKSERDIVEILLEHGADVNIQGGACGSAIQAAAFSGEEGIAGVLLEHGADVSARSGPFFGSALQTAADNGRIRLVEMLLERGADVNDEGGLAGGALQAAIIADVEGVIGLLLEHGANTDGQGCLPTNATQGKQCELFGNDHYCLRHNFYKNWSYLLQDRGRSVCVSITLLTVVFMYHFLF